MHTITIDRLKADASERDVGDLAALLLDAVASNAGVSFLSDLTLEGASAWWRGVLGTTAIVLVARDEQGIVGTVQLQPSWAPNQPHRADVAKLIVHSRARRRGIARSLMLTLERTARDAGFTLLLLDTRPGDHPERLYLSMGWLRVGTVPNFALNPDGRLSDTVFYYKQL